MNNLIEKPEKGSGMLLAFFVLSLVFIFSVSLVSLTWNSLALSKRDVLRARAFASAEAGVDKAISMLMTGDGTWRTSHPSGSPNDHSADTFYTFSVATGETTKVCVRDGAGITNGKIVVTSIGTATLGGKTATKTISAVLDMNRENVCVWNNAIFGGVGQAGKSINGNVAIRGSVHLLGDGEDFTDLDGDGRWDDDEAYTDSNGNGQYDLGEPYVNTDGDGHRDAREPFYDANGNGTRDPALTVTDMASEIAGSASLGNNYDIMPSSLRSLVPSLPQTMYGGEWTDSLNTKLRVKHGRVNISGSACVGYSNLAGNSLKETVDGTYVSDGFGGNQGSAGVHSDNGYSHGYDLGDDVVDFPLLDFGTYTEGGTTYPTYMDYLRSNATVYTGNVTLNNGTAKTISGPNGSIVLDAAGNMTVSGIVYIDGTVSFGPSKSLITYQGSGTIVSTHSAYVHCNLMPKTNFPRYDALGLVARDRVELATGSGDAQLTMAIAMYAQHQIVSSKQNEIAGTMVASYYSMSNVPRLYQVPELVNSLPPGLPGGEPVYIVSVTIDSWREK